MQSSDEYKSRALGAISDAITVGRPDRFLEQLETQGVEIVFEVTPQPDESLEAADVVAAEVLAGWGSEGSLG